MTKTDLWGPSSPYYRVFSFNVPDAGVAGLRGLKAMSDFPCADTDDVHTCYHATSIDNLRPILEVGLQPGPGITDSKCGVYVEQQGRAFNVMTYCCMTHSTIIHPLMITGVVLECMANRSDEGASSAGNPDARNLRQWVQKNPASVQIRRIHLVMLNSMYLTNDLFRGIFTVSQGTLESLSTDRPHDQLRSACAAMCDVICRDPQQYKPLAEYLRGRTSGRSAVPNAEIRPVVENTTDDDKLRPQPACLSRLDE